MDIWLYTNLLQALKGECLSSVFSPDVILISASAAPHCGVQAWDLHHSTVMKNRVTSLACSSTWEAVLAAPNAIKKWGRKNMVEMTRKVAGEACMAIFQPTPGFKIS